MIKYWYAENIKLLLENGLDVRSELPEYLLIRNFKLPPFYNKEETKLLIRHLQNLSYPESISFYLTKSLRRTDSLSTDHYFENENWNDLKHKGWARLSLHVDAFSPNLDYPRLGDGFLTLINTVFDFLSQKDGV